MPTATYTPIASITLAATASSVVFSGLPQTFRDLILVVNGSATDTVNILRSFNSDTTAGNYSWVQMRGDGSTTSSGATTGREISTVTTDRFVTKIQIFDYAQTDKHKTALTRDDISSFHARAWATRWANTSAITSLTLSLASANFTTGSTFNLYGIVA
jgi:hypothetical protein